MMHRARELNPENGEFQQDVSSLEVTVTEHLLATSALPPEEYLPDLKSRATGTRSRIDANPLDHVFART
jgi:hypothetical protein